jgi:hypothetical protein
LARGFNGTIFFAGDYLTAHHSWILGSLQSSARAVSLAFGNESGKFLFPDLSLMTPEQLKTIKEIKEATKLDKYPEALKI